MARWRGMELGPFCELLYRSSLGQRRPLSLGGGLVGGERAARCPVKWEGDSDTQDEAW